VRREGARGRLQGAGCRVQGVGKIMARNQSREIDRRAWICLSVVLLMSFLEATGALACKDFDKASNSRWRTEIRDGVSWLITPCGDPFFSIGINVLTGGADERYVKGRTWYSWATFYPNFDMWLLATRVRLRDWGFNSAGGWSLPMEASRLPTTPNLELGRNSTFHWFDPFHPETESRMRAMAHELVKPYRGNPRRIGYYSDNEVGWWNGALFVYYIQKPATSHTKQKLVDMLRDHYKDDWSWFSRDFEVSRGIRSFDDLARTGGTTAMIRPGGEGIQAVRKWTKVIAGHYYRLVHDALRNADPDALVLGDRLPIYYDPMAVRAMAPYVDVISTNYNVDSPDGWIAHYFFDGLRQLTGDKPVLISEWFFAAQENRTGNRNNGHLMTVQTQAERARGAETAIRRFATEPRIVGLHWFMYWDHPKGGRMDGEDYNFGLVDIDDRPYEELTEALSRANRDAVKTHRAVPVTDPKPSEGTLLIPKAAIDPRDKHLGDWPKERALLPPLVASLDEVPFGEFYLAWDDRGINLAMIAMDYQDAELMAYEGDYPIDEAFRVHWGVDVGKGGRQFTLYVIPPSRDEDVGKDAYKMYARLCAKGEGAACEPVPGSVTTYFGSDQPRIVVELSLPWQAMGLEAPPTDGQLRMEIAATAFHRSRWMSLSGLPPEQAMRDRGSWRQANLQPKRSLPGAE
jgi:hypothetical protein